MSIALVGNYGLSSARQRVARLVSVFAKATPKTVEKYGKEALQQFNNGNYAGAQGLYLAAIEEAEKNAAQYANQLYWFYHYLAACYEYQGEDEAAQAACEKAVGYAEKAAEVATDQKEATLRVWLRLCGVNGDKGARARALEAWLRISPSPDIQIRLVHLYLDLEQKEEAQRVYCSIEDGVKEKTFTEGDRERFSVLSCEE